MNEAKKQCCCKDETHAAENDQTICESDNNWITEEHDKKNWEGWLVSQPRIEKIIQIRHAVTKLWRNCEERYPQPPYYTPHGPAHAKSVEDIVHRLLPGDSYKKLKEIERFYLLAAAWTHDVGMIRGLNEKEDAKLHPAKIREEHHKRSEQYIVNNYLMLDIEAKDAQALGLLAFFHRRQEEIEKCPEPFVVGTETVRLRLLAAYLRLADALDVGQSRAPSSDYAICLAYNIPFTSKLHWIKSRLVSGIAVLPKEQRILVHFKQPHEQSLKEFFSKRNNSDRKGTEQESSTQEDSCKRNNGEGTKGVEQASRKNTQEDEHFSDERYDVGMLKQNLVRLQQTVMNGLREELNSVKTTLVRGGITTYLDVTSTSTEMVIDDQVFPEIIRLADDLDMIVHPSATRLILLLIDTIRHIIDRYLVSSNKNDECISSSCNETDCKNINACQMPRLIKKEIGDFILEIKEQVISQRRCHIGLERLVDNLELKIKDCSVNEIEILVREWHNEIEKERRRVRVESYNYFNKVVIGLKKGNERGCEEYIHGDLICKNFDKERGDIKNAINNIVRNKSNENSDVNSSACINILVYGYSELVIKSISGFRDSVMRMVLSELNESFLKESENDSVASLINKLHKINIEEIASSIFRIFVCEGQPKTITAPNDTLQYHDGTRFAIALGRRGFKNVIIIPDLVAGSLLNRTQQNASKVACNDQEQLQMHFVLLGVNGVKLNLDSSASSQKENIFLHSSGHMAIASLAKCKNSDMTRLVLVLSMSKCKFHETKEDVKKNSKCDEFEIRQGYRFWNGHGTGEKTRKEAFFVRDMQVQRELREYEISLYNPREDCVSLSMADDVISDSCFIENVNETFVNVTCNEKESIRKILKLANEVDSYLKNNHEDVQKILPEKKDTSSQETRNEGNHSA